GCWLLAELARGVVFTGFPWGAAGYTQIDGPLAALAPWLGVYGIGAVAAWMAAAGAGALPRRVGLSPPSDGALKPTLQAGAGVPLGDFEHGYTNSVVGLSKAGEYRYDKHHLVPFGEFIPFGFRWFVDLMRIPLGDFGRGPLVVPPFAVKGQRVTPNICYEDLF